MSIISSTLVRMNDSRFPRDPKTGILHGAEARTLGPTDTDKAVLFVHGFIATPNSFADLPDHVAAQGWHVRIMLLPGHGTTPLDFQKTEPGDLEDAVQKELELLQERYSTVVLLGHSMGGALSTIIAARKQPQGLILVAPYFSITKFLDIFKVENLAIFATPLLKWLPKPQAMHQVSRRSIRSKLIMYNWIPMKGVHTAIALAEKAQQAGTLSKLLMPVMMIHAAADKVTDPQSSKKVYKNLPTKNKTYHELKKSNHVVFWDHDRDLVKEQVSTFLQQWK